jgi:hypothetical protein
MGARVVHFVVQGALKVVVFEDAGEALPMAWMAASATIPFLVFLVPCRSLVDESGSR